MKFHNILTVTKKELRVYFNSPLAYIFIVLFLMVSSWLSFQGFFLENQASVRSLFAIMPVLFLLFIPAVTMRVWAEEKKIGTIETLLTYPVKDSEIVLGKYLASFLFIFIALLLTVHIPIIVSFLGNLDTGVVIASYLSTLLLGAAYLALGLWISSFTKNQIVAFILSLTISFLLYIVGTELVLYNAPNFLIPIFYYISLGSHFESMARGILDTRDIVYYVLFIMLFVYLNIRSIESRKWK
jgi:ABC-2 type transport system permease protein